MDEVTITTLPTGGAKPDVFVIRDGILIRKDKAEPIKSIVPDFKPPVDDKADPSYLEWQQGWIDWVKAHPLSDKRPYIMKAQKTDWETPHWLFDKYWDEFDGFDCDPCCDFEHHTALKIAARNGGLKYLYDEKIDGLKQNWFGKVWMNPPYGNEEVDWIAKAYNETQCGNADVVVALLPVRTDTKRWHKYIHDKAEIRFLKGRLRFVGAPASAPFPSCIVIWRKPKVRESIDTVFARMEKETKMTSSRVYNE